MAELAAPPRWSLTSIFPGVDSPAFGAAAEALTAGLTQLIALYDRCHIRGGANIEATPADVAAFEQVVAATNTLLEQVRTRAPT